MAKNHIVSTFLYTILYDAGIKKKLFSLLDEKLIKTFTFLDSRVGLQKAANWGAITRGVKCDN